MLVRARSPKGEEKTLHAVDFRESLAPAGWVLVSGNLGEGGPMLGKGGQSQVEVAANIAADEARQQVLKEAQQGAAAGITSDPLAEQVVAARAELRAAGFKLAPNMKPETLFAKLAEYRSQPKAGE